VRRLLPGFQVRRLAIGLCASVAIAAAGSSCSLFVGGKAPWPAGKTGVPFGHADVVTLNQGYQRTKSSVLVRQITRPTRAALDFAAYHGNFMNADPPPDDPAPAGKPAAGNPFGGNIEKTTLTGDIARTPPEGDIPERAVDITPGRRKGATSRRGQ
jgi:alginate O-acetyltransferase complex protein AlgJ